MTDASSITSSSDEDNEPRLKYERMASDLKCILTEDSASCLSVNNRLMVLGTHWGKTHILDLGGNAINDFARISAASSIVSVSVDHAGENYVCATENKVFMRSLISADEKGEEIDMNSPINSLSIDPIFHLPESGKRFIVGDKEGAAMYDKTSFFNRYKRKLVSNDSNVKKVNWRANFAAWNTSKGIRVYDVVNAQHVAIVKHERDEVNGDVHIAWSDKFHFFAAIGNRIKACKIKKRVVTNTNLDVQSSLPVYMVDIVSSFTLENHVVCGIAPFSKDPLPPLILLTLPKGQDKNGKPRILVVEPKKGDGNFNAVSTDLLQIRGHEHLSPKDYSLHYLLDDQFFFIVSPKDVVIGKPRDVDDRIDWLMDKNNFAEALNVAEKSCKVIKRHQKLNVGLKFLDHLLEQHKFEEAGKLCVRIFADDKNLWQENFFKFKGELRKIAPFLPANLDASLYEMTLFDVMRTDQEAFLQLIKTWPHKSYSVLTVIKSIQTYLIENPDEEVLQRALAVLFSYQGKYERAVEILLNLGHEDVFEIIIKHKLYNAIVNLTVDLFKMDKQKSADMFVDNVDYVKPELIASKLHGEHLFIFLDTLVNKQFEESKKFHGSVVKLYANFAKHKLLPFLKRSDSYPIQEALDICKERNFIDEQIYVLALMGNAKDALALIIDSMMDIHKAVKFCKEHDYPELWKELIDRSLDKPYFINVLLRSIGTHVDPRIIVDRIPAGMEIPGLRDSLVQIIRDYGLQVNIQEACQRILAKDCVSLLNKQVKMQKKSIEVKEEDSCDICKVKIIGSTLDMIAFECEHKFHVKCVKLPSNICHLCNIFEDNEDDDEPIAM